MTEPSMIEQRRRPEFAVPGAVPGAPGRVAPPAAESDLPEGGAVVSVTDARQAVAPHIVRYVLGAGLVLAVLALGLTLAIGAR